MNKFKGYDNSLCYQSRLGPVKWLSPSIQNQLEELSAKNIKHVLIFPLSFVSENLETLYELDIKYRNLAYSLGFEKVERAAAVQENDLFISALKDIILNHEE